ncbi:MAG: hypothetical protein ABIR32_00950, partial [Ilumatobacteraceae bacterium]
AGRLSLSNVLRRFAPRRILAFSFSGAIVACVPFLLGACSDVVGLGWATAILPVFITAGLLTVLRPLPSARLAAA